MNNLDPFSKMYIRIKQPKVISLDIETLFKIYHKYLIWGKNKSIKTVTKFDTKELKEVNKEIRTYNVEDHFKDGWDNTRELYEELREKIMWLDSRLEEKAVSPYIWYKIGTKVAVSLKIQKSKIVLELLRTTSWELNDPENKTRDVEWAMRMWNKNVSHYNIINSDDIDYGIMLTKQVLKKFFQNYF